MAGTSEELARLAQLRDQGVLTEEEFQAQKAAVLRGTDQPTTAPTAPAKKTVGAKGCVVIAAIIVVLIVIGAIASGGGGSGASSTDSAKPAVPPIAVTATELFEAYEANEAAAQEQYGKRPLLVSGTVKAIDLDFTDEPVVQLKTPNQFMPAQARLTEASQKNASSLAKGQDVKLLCGKVQEMAGTPMLSDCELQ